MIVAATLIALLVLPPIAHAGVVHFWWDNVYFVAGTDIDYPHPDNVYYGISPSSDWTRLGKNLYHNQINRDTSYAICIGTAIFIDIVALILGAKLGGSSTAYYVAGLATIVISTVISMAIDYFFVDERGCIWWWISWLFLYYLYKNLPYLSGINKEAALAEILAAFLCFGYFRVGMVTFHDPMGIGQPSPITLTIYVDGNTGGTTNPSPGTHAYEEGEVVTVTAIPSYFFNFRYWILDGPTPIPIYSNPITITMDSDHTLTAYFEYSGGFGCPTLFVWSGTGYVDYGVINIHNPSGEDVIREVPIQSEDIGINKCKAKFRLREGWEGLNYSESVIDQIKLYAIDNYGNYYLCPLISAKHSSLGNVLPQLLLSDDIRVQTLLLQTIDLTFIVPYQNIESFTFVIEGCNIFKEP
jgi:hypothetical protein